MLWLIKGDYVYHNEVIQIKDSSKNNFKVVIALVKYLSSNV